MSFSEFISGFSDIFSAFRDIIFAIPTEILFLGTLFFGVFLLIALFHFFKEW